MNDLVNRNTVEVSSTVKNTTTEKFITTKELAEELHVSVPTIRNIAKGLFDPEKVLFRGSKWRKVFSF